VRNVDWFVIAPTAADVLLIAFALWVGSRTQAARVPRCV
jgi:hypothetical protein